jgi:hypothetical protein
MRSQVAGAEPWTLRMEEKPNFEVAPLRGRLGLEGTWTEVLVRGLHRPALASLTGRRIGDYLAAELRGQLLERDVTVTVHDRMARGRAQKVRRVEPARFAGDRLPRASRRGRRGVRARCRRRARPLRAHGEPVEPAARLFPPGPLARVKIVPAKARVERWGERRLRARATDADGARVAAIACTWTLASGPGAVEAAGPTEAVFRAGEVTGTARVAVTARQGGREASAEAEVEVVEEIAGGEPRTGIPEPAFVTDPRGEWRSRVADGRREVNAAHRDHLSVEANPRRKLRYLAALLAKEIVLHSFPMPQGGMLLERLVSVLTVAERRLERG